MVNQPFFVMTSFWGPHAPYLPAADFADLYDPKDIAQWDSFTDDLLNKPYIHSIYRKYIFPGAANAKWDVWAKVISRYYAFVSMIDHQIGLILQHLRDKGLYDDT
ncbi:MAG: sulfatase-like hydrolase/transferase, partial [Chloroflexota bacterium]|nr:sulfatase-like hydrolase/transferase [Chloroflexota bacterium]